MLLLSGAVVAGVQPDPAVLEELPLGLSGDQAAALPAADQAGEGKLVPLRPGLALSAQQFLDPVVLLKGYYGRCFPWYWRPLYSIMPARPDGAGGLAYGYFTFP